MQDENEPQRLEYHHFTLPEARRRRRPLRRLWRAVRGIYAGEAAETRARRWWSREDRRMARLSLVLIEDQAAEIRSDVERQIANVMVYGTPNPEAEALEDFIANNPGALSALKYPLTDEERAEMMFWRAERRDDEV